MRSELTWPIVTGLVMAGSNGCDYWRSIVPFEIMNRHKFSTYIATYGEALHHKPDVLVCNRLGLGNDDAALSLIRQSHAVGTAVVVDNDDDSRIIPEDSPHYQGTVKRDAGIRAMRAADLVTCTTTVLAKRFKLENPNVAVLPNLVNTAHWRDLPKRTGPLTIGVHGGDSHYNDWGILEYLIPQIASLYPEVRFMFAGYTPSWTNSLKYKLGDRIVILPWTDLETYRHNVNQMDIGLCPLPDTEFNKAKSPIKWFEHTMCGAPVVASPTVYEDYIHNGYTGWIAKDYFDWTTAIRCLIDNPSQRRLMARRAKLAVISSWTMTKERAIQRMQIYRQTWREVIDGGAN